jgi:hypothetical protein
MTWLVDEDKLKLTEYTRKSGEYLHHFNALSEDTEHKLSYVWVTIDGVLTVHWIY